MKKYEYDVFISFPLTERNDKLTSTINTRDFYVSRRIYETLTHLLNIKTFFSEETLLSNNKSDFWDKIKEVVPKCRVLVVILSKDTDYDREFCKLEREIYLNRDPNERKIFFLVSEKTHKKIKTYDIMNIEQGKPEVIRWQSISQQQRFYNEINNFFEHNSKGNFKEVKICKNCHKIFYKGNEKGTICVHHDESSIRKDHKGKKYFIKFNCCNKIVHLENRNCLYDLSPGCIEERNHEFDD